MPKLKTPPIPRDYLTRHELLALVPLGMTSVDQLERKGIFPKRFGSNRCAAWHGPDVRWKSLRAARQAPARAVLHRRRAGGSAD